MGLPCLEVSLLQAILAGVHFLVFAWLQQFEVCIWSHVQEGFVYFGPRSAPEGRPKSLTIIPLLRPMQMKMQICLGLGLLA